MSNSFEKDRPHDPEETRNFALWTRAIARARKTESNMPIWRLLERGITIPVKLEGEVGRLGRHNEKLARGGRPVDPDTPARRERRADAAQRAIWLTHEVDISREQACRMVSRKCRKRPDGKPEFSPQSIQRAAESNGGEDFNPIWQERKRKAGDGWLQFKCGRDP